MDRNHQGRILYWDNVKGFLIIIVVCGHLCERYINDSSLLKHIWILIYSFHMPLFVFINGYFARMSKKPAWIKSLKMLGYYLLMQMLFVLGNHFILGKEFELSLLAAPSYCCWYLLFLVYVYLIAQCWPKSAKEMGIWIAGSFVLSFLAGFDTSIGHDYAVARTFYFLPFFLIGALAADLGVKKLKILVYLKKKWLVAAAVMLLVVFACLWKLGDMEWFNRIVFSGNQPYSVLYPEHTIFAVFNRGMAYIIAFVVGILILQFIPDKATVFSFLGNHTLMIYMVHIFILPMEFELIKDINFVQNKELNSVCVLFLLLVSVTIICSLIGIFNTFVIKKLIVRK